MDKIQSKPICSVWLWKNLVWQISFSLQKECNSSQGPRHVYLTNIWCILISRHCPNPHKCFLFPYRHLLFFCLTPFLSLINLVFSWLFQFLFHILWHNFSLQQVGVLAGILSLDRLFFPFRRLSLQHNHCLFQPAGKITERAGSITKLPDFSWLYVCGLYYEDHFLFKSFTIFFLGMFSIRSVWVGVWGECRVCRGHLEYLVRGGITPQLAPWPYTTYLFLWGPILLHLINQIRWAFDDPHFQVPD